MQNNPPKENPFSALIRQDAWNIEDFISLLKEAANRNKELVFFDGLADVISECSTFAAVLRFQDPRPIILSFIARSKIFSKSEGDFYRQTFEPALDAMISNSKCVHHISSSNFIKRVVIQGVKARFDLEPPFVRFITNVRSEIKMRAPV